MQTRIWLLQSKQIETERKNLSRKLMLTKSKRMPEYLKMWSNNSLSCDPVDLRVKLYYLYDLSDSIPATRTPSLKLLRIETYCFFFLFTEKFELHVFNIYNILVHLAYILIHFVCILIHFVCILIHFVCCCKSTTVWVL